MWVTPLIWNGIQKLQITTNLLRLQGKCSLLHESKRIYTFMHIITSTKAGPTLPIKIAYVRVLDEVLFQQLLFFLILHINKCCGYSLEVPCQGISNEYPQNLFVWRNKTYLSGLPSYLELLWIM